MLTTLFGKAAVGDEYPVWPIVGIEKMGVIAESTRGLCMPIGDGEPLFAKEP